MAKALRLFRGFSVPTDSKLGMQNMSNHTSKVLEAYETMAEEYNKRIEYKPHNAHYDRPNTLSLLPDVAGKNLLDAACGPGKYAEILMEKGAIVTGFDLSPKMIALAKERNQGQGTFFVHNLSHPFDFQEDNSIDIVLCALAMDYVGDWQPTIQEFSRVLKPGGVLVISMEHPFFKYLEHRSEQYFETEAVNMTWRGFGQLIDVHSYRRPLGTCITDITSNGFYIDHLLEPKPTQEFEAIDPKHFKELNAFPGFLCLRAIKRTLP
jgi:ubiquinone/menaquinone biosynthesis C-methylase UbiE